MACDMFLGLSRTAKFANNHMDYHKHNCVPLIIENNLFITLLILVFKFSRTLLS